MNSIEKLISKTKTSARVFLTSLLTATLLSVPSCSSDPHVTNNPKDPEITETIPNQPKIYNIVAEIKAEPLRGMTLKIFDLSKNELGFEIQKSDENEVYHTIATLQENTSGRFEYTDWEGIKAETYYVYRIRAYNNAGSSNWETHSGKSADWYESVMFATLTADTYVTETYPNTNFGKENCVEIGGRNPEWIYSGWEEGFLKFNLPTIPDYGKFKSATLRLEECGGGNSQYPGRINVVAGLVFSEWNENTMTFNTRPSSRIGTYSSNSHDPNSPYEGRVEIDVTSQVRKLCEGVYPNHGFILFTDTKEAFCNYYSKESYPDGAAKLLIRYRW